MLVFVSITLPMKKMKPPPNYNCKMALLVVSLIGIGGFLIAPSCQFWYKKYSYPEKQRKERFMTHHDMEVERKTGTSDVTYNLVSMLYHTLHGAENYTVYARDAEKAGEKEVAEFFRQYVEEERKRSERAKQLLKNRL
jgi:hypothetical protein